MNYLKKEWFVIREANLGRSIARKSRAFSGGRNGLLVRLAVTALAVMILGSALAPAAFAGSMPEQLPPTLTQGTGGINPVLLTRFDAFRTFIYQQYGTVLEIRSGYRSTDEQAVLFRTLPRGMANPPGVSLHEKGEAIDYTNYSPTYNQHLGQFGLKLPFPGKENWHIERADN